MSRHKLDRTTRWVGTQICATGPVLIHRREGRGRSAMIAAATLVSLGLPLSKAYRLVVKAQDATAMSLQQLAALEEFASPAFEVARRPDDATDFELAADCDMG